jgi:endonuclease/exonuclease/phosphatase family metal-dependent hydrolase
MAVYNKSGNEINNIYGVDGSQLSQAYDIDQNELLDTSVLKVMTYNVQYFNNINAQTDMQVAIINNNNADVVGIQELRSYTPSTMPTVGVTMFEPYKYMQFSEHNNKIGYASKRALSNVVCADFTNQDPRDLSTYNETRAYMKCKINVAGKPITWINTHLCFLTQSYKFLQMAEIFDLAEAENYVIITGDFNSFCEEIGDTEYNNMFKQFVDAGYNLANCTPERGVTKTWTDAVTASSISEFTSSCDNIITSSNIDIENVSYDLTKLSYLNGTMIDHVPVVTTLRIN